MTPEQRANLRLRAEQGGGLCLYGHTISERDNQVWVCCENTDHGKIELGRITVDPDGPVPVEAVTQEFVLSTLGAHERAVTAAVILGLLDDVERLLPALVRVTGLVTP